MPVVAHEDLVLSIPAGTSFHLVTRHALYSCPADRRDFQRTRYVTFRRTGGVMERLYRLMLVVEIPGGEGASLGLLPSAERERTAAYLSDARALWGELPSRLRLLVLSREDQIELRHQPKLARNTQSPCYIRMDALLDEGGPPILPASREARR